MPPKGKGGKKAVALPVFKACEDGDVEALAEIIKAAPAALESRNGDGWTPLLCAAFCGELEAVELLLSKGADAAAVCKDGDSALHYASAQGHAEVIKRLAREPSVSFTLTDADGETPEDVAQGGKIKKLLEQLAAAREADGEEPAAAGEDDDDDA